MREMAYGSVSERTYVRTGPAQLYPPRQPFLEIRMLGAFEVCRPSGNVVAAGEWRTGKFADLVRLLALEAGDPVPTQRLIGILWPSSESSRAKASLRTAASQVRHVIGGDHLDRSPAGLRLKDVWVDVSAFRTLAGTVHRLRGTGPLVRMNDVAQKALALYRGDFAAHDERAEWAVRQRRELAALYRDVLCDAAETALELGSAIDAVDYACRATSVDPFSERATRSAMRAHAELGEMPRALEEFERCRALLARKLAIEPSPQTRDLRRLLLTTVRSRPPVPQFVPRPHM